MDERGYGLEQSNSRSQDFKTCTVCLKLKSSSEMLSIVEEMFNRSFAQKKKRLQYATTY